jgi:Zn-dependent alcohol dehydrogenase
VALAAVTRAELKFGVSTLICGVGPIGLVTLLCAAAAGAEPIIVTDLEKGRLDWAKRLVPRVHTVQVTKQDSPKQTAERIKEYAGSEGIAYAFECTGVEASINTAIYVPIFILGNAKIVDAIWWTCVCHRCWKRISTDPVYASFCQRNRSQVSVSIQQYVAEGNSLS